MATIMFSTTLVFARAQAAAAAAPACPACDVNCVNISPGVGIRATRSLCALVPGVRAGCFGIIRATSVNSAPRVEISLASGIPSSFLSVTRTRPRCHVSRE